MILQKTLDLLNKKKIKNNSNRELRNYTTIKIGGKPALTILPESREQLTDVLTHLNTESQSYVLLGGGSNVAFQDHPENLIIIINRASHLKLLSDTEIYVDSGVTNSAITAESVKKGFGGLEFLAGIPGTVGGAAAVHAGAFGKSISEVIIAADIIDNKGDLITIGVEEFDFKYRNSRFKYSIKEAILGLTLKIHTDNKEDIRTKTGQYLEYRKVNHPPASSFSAGCFFKNPVINGQKKSAGKAIEESGLKGFATRDLTISPKHANFLINKGTASFRELESFTDKISSIVKEKEGIDLEREIIFIDSHGRKY